MAKLTCRGCGELMEAEEGVTGLLCLACVHKLGVEHPQKNEQRPPLPCARCGHPVLVRCAIRERGGEYAKPRPLSATFAVDESVGIFSSKVTREAQTDTPIGLFEAFVCRACGFTEWYCDRPGRIPIGLEYGTVLLDFSKPPYR